MNKKELYKALAALAFIIIVFSIASRLLTKNSMTLADYALQNPEKAYPSKEIVSTDESKNDDLVLEASPTLPNEEEVEEMISPLRVTYQNGFFYEPLSEELIAYITGTSYPEASTEVSYDDLVYVNVLHKDFDGKTASGELICNKIIAEDLLEIFYDLYLADYQIEKMVLIDEYEGDDILSMEDNNTSCFNYRTIAGSSTLSQHSLGLAIDINPLYNPYITYNKNGSTNVSPVSGEIYADRLAAFPYKIDETDLCYRLFVEHGFSWGGNWNSSKDYQHFQKIIVN